MFVFGSTEKGTTHLDITGDNTTHITRFQLTKSDLRTSLLHFMWKVDDEIVKKPKKNYFNRSRVVSRPITFITTAILGPS